MVIDLTQVVIALVGLMFAVITKYAVPWLKSKIKEAGREDAAFWAIKAVDAAEKLYKESGMGAQKKEYVKQFLEGKGFTFNPGEIDVVIESAVLEMQHAIVG